MISAAVHPDVAPAGFFGLHDACIALVDVLERLLPSYLHPEVEPPQRVLYGLGEPKAFPALMVFPSEGLYESHPSASGCGLAFREETDVTIRIVYQKPKTDARENTFPELIRYTDAIALLLAANLMLPDADGTNRVNRCEPAGREFDPIVETSRGDRKIWQQNAEFQARIRGLEVWSP